LKVLPKSQTFSPDWPKLGLIRAELRTNIGKTWFSRVEISIT